MFKIQFLLFVLITSILLSGCGFMQQNVVGYKAYVTNGYTKPFPTEMKSESTQWFGIVKTESYEIKIDPGNLIRYAYPSLTGNSTKEIDAFSPCIVGNFRF